ncbi:recombinase family protein [Glycomyces albidus]|uniref:Recombinase domain-containing protein n=1 Tax=Glycomyces albidus TaxID=2656774 RepID=A0A6L5G4Q8_9ACTN|nr:recombinase family protein [Glycomyces albidus]MQM24636.1 hypothetical protein [Glycomyces albidus]
MVAKRLEGWSFQKIADWLNEEGVRTYKDKTWMGHGVGKLLGARNLVGQHVFDGRVITDEAGEPIQFAEPLISFADFEALRERSNHRNDGTGERRTQRPKTQLYLLKDFLLCGACGNKMYRFASAQNGIMYVRYGCKGTINHCPSPASVKLEPLDKTITDRFLDDIGDQEVYERKFIPATGTAAKLERLAQTIRDLRDDRDAGLWEGEDDEYRARMKALIAKRDQLEAEPADAARWEQVPTGRTYAQAWEAADIAERRDLFAAAGFKAVACRWAVDAPDWYDPDRDVKLVFRGCRVYATWVPQQF